MKKLTVIAAGFGWQTLERGAGRPGGGPYRIAGLSFEPKPSVFPAVTCVAQASLRTGLSPFADAVSRPPVDAVSHPPVDAVSHPPVDAVSHPPVDALSRPPVDAVSRPPVDAVSHRVRTDGITSSSDAERLRVYGGHGMISNGWWSETLRKPFFWEQSARLVKGPRVWDRDRPESDSSADGRARSTSAPRDASVGLFFLQQSLGENVDVIVSPAPIHKHGGGMMMSCYTKPTGMAGVLEKLCGKFPLWRYWGPLASPKVGRMCIRYFEEMTNVHDVDEAYLYLPTLDYAAQKYGPGSPQDRAAFREFTRQLERLADICMRRGCRLEVTGDYEITPVTEAPVRPNVTLRQAGLFKTRTVGGRAYPDFYQSAAFAMCDHEFCVICGERREEAVKALLATGRYESPTSDLRSPTFDLLLAKPGSWCEYKWWTDNREAPDFASHVDIHNKPGYDPTELFFFGRGIVKGTHGRASTVARSSDV